MQRPEQQLELRMSELALFQVARSVGRALSGNDVAPCCTPLTWRNCALQRKKRTKAANVDHTASSSSNGWSKTRMRNPARRLRRTITRRSWNRTRFSADSERMGLVLAVTQLVRCSDEGRLPCLHSGAGNGRRDDLPGSLRKRNVQGGGPGW